MNGSPRTLVGQVIDDRYRIDVLVARGGMATVYRAHDLRLDRTVAVKVMNQSLAEDASFVSRFQREAKAAARLSHPNLVTVFDQGAYKGLAWLAMEYIPGHTLRQVIDAHAPLDPDRALGVAEQILEGLSAAHAAGFVHRDIKPENVLMTADGTMRLVDFGLTRALTEAGDSRDTRGVVLGTVAYMSPEQVEVAATDARSDLYATGIVLFEMLTGAVPFTAPTPLAVAYRHVHDDVPAPGSQRAGISTDVDALVQRATAKDPNHRFQNAAEFLDAVRGADLSAPAAVSHAQGDESSQDHGSEAVAPMDDMPTTAVAVGAARTEMIAPAGSLATRARLARTRSWDDIASATTVLGPESSHGTLIADRQQLTAALAGSSAQFGPAVDTPTRKRGHVRSSRRFSRSLLTVFLVTVTTLVAVGSWWLGSLQTATLVDVRGMTISEADQRLALFGIDIAAVEERYDQTVPAGAIISTDPTPEAKVRTGAVVSAIVSLGPEPREVPGVVGLSEQEAVSQLESAGFTVTVKKALPFVVVNRIYSQNPGSGTELTTGSTVTINLV
jgi:eukaryotic-like serine/threonine-protein kinase